MSETPLPDRWLVFLPVVAIVFLSLFPQLFMIAGLKTWNGSYFVSNYDEPAYSAYVNALINGAPRKNDPFLGRSDGPETPQPETLYSIQFVPSYSIALPARLLGLSVSTAFILTAILIAVWSTLILYKLFRETTGDSLVAAVGPVAVLCLGTAVAFQGEMRNLLDGRVLADFFPFLRRYQPGLAFPLFFVFCLCVWRSMRAVAKRKATTFAIVAAGVFAVLVFSYFYLWTAAAAWLLCFAVISVIADRTLLKNVAVTAGIIATVGLAALVTYFYLLSQRSADLDSVQLLTFTRMPKLSSTSMVIGLVIATIAIFMPKRQDAKISETRPLILAFALTPVILFNQQIVTGRSLQPVHYELFIANYLVLTAFVLLLPAVMSGSGRSPAFRRGLAYLGMVAFAWGVFEAYGSTVRNFTPAQIRDASVPAITAANKSTSDFPIVLATNFVTADFIPSIGRTSSFWNPHTSSAGGLSVEENKQLFYSYLYFSGYDVHDLERALADGSFEVTAAVFGSERALPSLTGGGKEITVEEVRAETARFAEYAKSFNESIVYARPIDFVVVPAETEMDFANLDRWYSRETVEHFGLFDLYRVAPKAR